MQRNRQAVTLIAWLICQTAAVIAQQPGQVATLKELRETGIAGRTVSTTGVVTCVEQHHFFIQDETNAMQVQAWNAQQVVDAGDLVVVRGVLVGFGAGIQIRSEDVNRQGTRALPAPETPKASELLTGGSHCQRVRITGAVHDVIMVRGEVKLMLRSDGVLIHVCWHPTDANEPRPDELLDAVVEVTGVAHSGAGPDGRATGGRIPIISRDDLRIIKPGNADIFQQPIRTLAQVRTEVMEHHERLRMSGTVTYASPASWFYFQDGTGMARGGRGLFLDAPPDLRRPLQANPQLKAGDVIDVVGCVLQDQPGKALPWLIEGEWKVVRKQSPPPWEPMAATAILNGDHDGRPVSITGEVVTTKVEKDRDGYFIHMLTIEDDGVSFWALVQDTVEHAFPVKAGDYVRLNGVAMAFHGQGGTTERFRINLNSFADIHAAPKPWNMHHLGRWFAGLLVLAAGGAIWIVMLRRQVRHQTAKLLAANDELARFKQVADSSTDNISMATLENKPLYMNAAGRAMLGIGADQDLNEITFDQITTPVAQDLMFNVGLPHAFEHGHWQAELNMRKLSGEEVPVSFVGLVLRGPNGQPQYISSISRNISDRHQLEKQLRESIDHERELNQLKSAFVNTISHEFRTPLGIILFSSSMMRRFSETFTPAERTAQLNAIDEAVERMNELVEQSLSLGRAEVAAPKRSTFELKTFSARVIDEVMSSTSYRSPISLLCPDDLPSAHTDETMLRTILVNLLGNAVKYSPAGSPISLSIGVNDNNSALFVVRDHGPGLSEEDLPKLFTTFHRGKGVEGIPGTGLGLAIVKRCAEAIGGTVTARNATGGGAEFSIELPLFVSSP